MPLNTKVCFRKYPEGDVIALFPEEKWDNQGHIASYMRIGQHGGAARWNLDNLEAATPEEYSPLRQELEGIGYTLEIVP